MKKFIKVICVPLVLLFCGIILTACGGAPEHQGAEINLIGFTKQPAASHTTRPDESEVTVPADTYAIKVPNAQGEFDFTDVVEVGSRSLWRLETESESGKEIHELSRNRKINLSEGDNLWYITVFPDGGTPRSYPVNVVRRRIYTVTFRLIQDGRVIDIWDIEEDGYAMPVEYPETTGYNVGGYQTDGWDFDFNTPINRDYDIYPKYVARQFTITYHSKMRGEDGPEETREQIVTFGESVAPLSTSIFGNQYTYNACWDFWDSSKEWDNQLNEPNFDNNPYTACVYDIPQDEDIYLMTPPTNYFLAYYVTYYHLYNEADEPIETLSTNMPADEADFIEIWAKAILCYADDTLAETIDKNVIDEFVAEAYGNREYRNPDAFTTDELGRRITHVYMQIETE